MNETTQVAGLRNFVPQAIQNFVTQDDATAEFTVLGDGRDGAGLIWLPSMMSP